MLGMLPQPQSDNTPPWPWRDRQSVAPDHAALRGAAAAAAVVTFGLLFAFAHELTAGAWAAQTIALVVFLGGLFAAGCALATLIVLRLVAARLPRVQLSIIAGCGAVLWTLVFGRRDPQVVAFLVVGALLPTLMLGAGAWTLIAQRADQDRARRTLATVSLVLGALLLVAGVAWYRWPGPEVTPAFNAAYASGGPVTSITTGDPSAPGPYRVLRLTYGSGGDLYRPEYGAHVGLRSPTVDGRFLLPSWRGVTGWLRSRFWGFGPEALPLTARVWYPEGPGPFPLVLIVHGNHHMMDFSDTGYRYLCELLASRGMIAVSVGQNYLNMSWTDIRMFGIRGLVNEEAARGWLLLKHVEQFGRWNATLGTPFSGKVDMGRIALVGHSRGGEAALIAAQLNRLPAYPDDALHTFDFGFQIRSIVTIAPSDGLYAPAGHETTVDGVDYMTIQGGYDGDLTPFAGIRQYNRIVVGGEGFHFKTAVFVDRANHGQFNSTWGRADRSGFPDKGLLNLSSILPESAQQQIAKVFISGFLDASLRGNRAYLPLFRDARSGRQWLPETVYLTRYSDTGTRTLANYEEDADTHTGSVNGVTLEGQGLNVWHEGRVALKYGDANTHAAYLGWHRDPGADLPAYRLTLGTEESHTSLDDALVFSLADVRLSFATLPAGVKANMWDARRPLTEAALDLSVELRDRAGLVAEVPLNRVSLLQPQLAYYPLKARFFKSSDGLPYEPTFQRFEFPLRWFQEAAPGFDPTRIAAVRFLFNRSPSGILEIDNIGFRAPDSTIR